VESETLARQRTTTAPRVGGPRGAAPSAPGHRRSQRPLTDLPWGTRSVRLQRTGRNFVCRQAPGVRRLCTERWPALGAGSARQTGRLVAALQAIGLVLGGPAGARLAAGRRLPPRPAPRLRRVRAALVPRPPALQAMGVDEWAWRRGHRDSTLRVERATPRVVARRLERSAARAGSCVMVGPAATRADDAPRDLDPRCPVATHVARAYALSQDFLAMVRERRGHDLEAWRAEASPRGMEARARFARGLQADLAAITAGRTRAWSNGRPPPPAEAGDAPGRWAGWDRAHPAARAAGGLGTEARVPRPQGLWRPNPWTGLPRTPPGRVDARDAPRHDPALVSFTHGHGPGPPAAWKRGVGRRAHGEG
jgi:hypothetical protein